MRLAMLSDTHFGDPNSALVQSVGGGLRPGPRYGEFAEAVGRDNDYLVVAGDIFDFSVASYADAYQAAACFFQQVRDDGIARRILYLPGNHDADMWHLLQYERNVIHRVKNRKPPAAFQHSIPAVLDDRRASSLRDVRLCDVARRPGSEPYGGMFLDDLTRPGSVFYFAFPNLYIVTDSESVLVTHGQYLEGYWSLAGEVLPEIVGRPPFRDLDIERMASLNFPLGQLACTGVGQAGILTALVRTIENDYYTRQPKEIVSYAKNGIRYLGRRLGLGWPVRQIFTALMSGIAKDRLGKAIGNKVQTRYDLDFLGREEVRTRFDNYLGQCEREVDGMNTGAGPAVPFPDKVIFGHTHQPIPWDKPLVYRRKGSSVDLYNMGGWLQPGGVFCGAEVFVYETGKGFSSRSIR